MSENTVSFGTFVTSGTVLRTGTHISNGKKVDVTPDIIRRIVQNAKDHGKPTPLWNRHNGLEIGKNMKLEHTSDFSAVELKTLITDSDRYNVEILQGNDKISPDLQFFFDDGGNLVDAVLLGASLTNNPGMNFESITATKLEFSAGDAPIDAPSSQSVTRQEDNNNVSVNADTLKSIIKNIIEESMTGNEWTPPTGDNTPIQEQAVEQNANSPGATSNTSSGVDVDSISTLIQDAVARAIEAKFTSMEQVKASEQKQEEIKSMAQADNPQISKEILEDYAKAIAERDQFRAESEKAVEREYQGELVQCRNLGIKNPERYVANAELSYNQKITLLKNIRENYAKTAPAVKPMTDPLTANTTRQPGNAEEITVDRVAQYLNANTPEMKKMLSELSLFKDGKFIGR